MTRRKHGTGAITPRRGRHLARVRVRGRLRSVGTFDTYDWADRVLSAASSKLASPEYVAVGGSTLREIGERCLDCRELDGLGDVGTDRNRFKCHIAPCWLAAMPVKAIAPQDVRRWLEELAKKDTVDRRGRRKVSRQTRKHCLNLLRACFAQAITDGLIETNPALGIKIRDEGDTGDSWTFLTPREQRALAACPQIPEADRLRIQFAMYTGLHQREQWCLMLGDVKLDAPTGPHVVVRYGAPGRATKSKKIRRVPLIGDAITVTRRWLELLPNYAPKNPLSLAFPTPRGCRRDRGKLYGFHDLRKKAGITRPVRWHDLRHTCASSLAAGWWGRAWRLEEVREVLGHSSIEVTQRYAHLATSVIQKAASETRGLPPAQLRSKRDPRGSKPAERKDRKPAAEASIRSAPPHAGWPRTLSEAVAAARGTSLPSRAGSPGQGTSHHWGPAPDPD